MNSLQSSTFEGLECVHVRLGLLPGSNACVDVSQIIWLGVGLVLVPALSGDEALPVVQVMFSHGLSLLVPSVVVNIVCPSSIEPTTINDRCESPFANAA